MRRIGKAPIRAKYKILEGSEVNVNIQKVVHNRSEAVRTGDRFKKWCELMGRQEPPKDVIDALNISMDTGLRVIKTYLPSRPDLWRNYHSFIAGRGHGRV